MFTLTTNQLPAHTHNYTIQNGSGNVDQYAAVSNGSAYVANGNTTTATTSSTGSGNAFSIFQPTLFISNLFILAFYP